jgi:hypothetical protein
MTTIILGGKKKGTKNLKGGGMFDMIGNVAGTALDMGASVLQKSATMVKGGTAPEVVETTQTGGRRRRRSSRRRSTSRSRKLRKRTGKVRRHATRSYRKTKKTKRS